MTKSIVKSSRISLEDVLNLPVPTSGIDRSIDYSEVEIPEDLLEKFIEYCEATDESSWCVDVVKSQNGSQSCLFGHLFDFAGNDVVGNVYWDHFESVYATTYMVYPVNDGKNERYPQETPKQRCLAYLKNLQSGKEMTTEQIIEKMNECLDSSQNFDLLM